MGDKDRITALLAIASDAQHLQAVQHIAAQKLLRATGIHYPHDGCAITLSTLLQQASMDIASVYGALDLGNSLKQRGWKVIPLGDHQAGNVGSTCGTKPRHGIDHIYLVLKRVNDQGEMVIADNQAVAPHFRWVGGHGKSPTTFFLRASI